MMSVDTSTWFAKDGKLMKKDSGGKDKVVATFYTNDTANEASRSELMFVVVACRLHRALYQAFDSLVASLPKLDALTKAQRVKAESEKLMSDMGVH